MALSSLFTFVWPGTHADLVSAPGWERDTRFDDGIYLKAAEASSDPTTGGAATHTHPNTGTSHTHTFAGGASSGSRNLDIGAGPTSKNGHLHLSKASLAATFSGAATANNPPNYEMIFCKPTTGSGVPNNGGGFWDDAALPASWSEHAASKGLLLKGPATSGDSGGTGGGDHTHNTDHVHGATGSNKENTRRNLAGGSSGWTIQDIAHDHQVSLNSHSANAGTQDSDPLWYKLRLIVNGTGGEDLPDQIIGLFLGTEAQLASESDWARVTGPDGVFLKTANNSGEVGDTGGAATHTHTGSAHNHVANAAYGTPYVSRSGGAIPHADSTHAHAWTIGNATNNLAANSSKSHYPSFQEAIFVRYTAPVVGGGPPPQRAMTGVGL